MLQIYSLEEALGDWSCPCCGDILQQSLGRTVYCNGKCNYFDYKPGKHPLKEYRDYAQDTEFYVAPEFRKDNKIYMLEDYSNGFKIYRNGDTCNIQE